MKGYFWINEDLEFSTFEEAAKCAEEKGFDCFSGYFEGDHEIKDFEQCYSCKKWFDSIDLWRDGVCEECHNEAQAILNSIPKSSPIGLGVRFGAPRGW